MNSICTSHSPHIMEVAFCLFPCYLYIAHFTWQQLLNNSSQCHHPWKLPESLSRKSKSPLFSSYSKENLALETQTKVFPQGRNEFMLLLRFRKKPFSFTAKVASMIIHYFFKLSSGTPNKVIEFKTTIRFYLKLVHSFEKYKKVCLKQYLYEYILNSLSKQGK